MSRIDEYRSRLRGIESWPPFLLLESRLPGPRANLELLHAVVEEGTTKAFLGLLEWTPDRAPPGHPGEFLAACGAAGLGASLARGDESLWPVLRSLAGDPRWRVREGVAMALQRLGDTDMPRLLAEMERWKAGTAFGRRALVAGLAEPRLLRDGSRVPAVLELFDEITASLSLEKDRKSDGFKALRKALGYGWSVVVAAEPSVGKSRFERWAGSPDPDVRWMVRQNLGKNRLRRLDPDWLGWLLARVS